MASRTDAIQTARHEADNIVIVNPESIAVPSERRRVPRLQPGPLRVEVSATCRGTLVDISELGALLELSDGHPVNAAITFRLEGPAGPLTLHGRVVRSTPTFAKAERSVWVEPSGYHVAVEFASLTDGGEKTLAALLQTAADRSA